jgi:ketosteroid isomerase-like protein
MSQENVEIVTRALDAYGRRDLELLRALNDPDVELLRSLPGAHSFSRFATPA